MTDNWRNEATDDVVIDKAYYRRHRFLYRIIAGLILVITLTFLVGPAIFGTNDESEAYWMNICTNAIVILLGLLVLDTRAEWREENRLKNDLVWKFSSSIHNEAVRAAEELTRNGWVSDGTLVSTTLPHTNLQGVRLWNANMRYVRGGEVNLANAQLIGCDLRNSYAYRADISNALLSNCNLEHARFAETNFQKANFYHSNLRGASLFSSDLQMAKFERANLQDAEFVGTNMFQLREDGRRYSVVSRTIPVGAKLQGANFTGASLTGVVFEKNGVKVQFDKETILPDGSKWSETEDLRRFTDISHPQYKEYPYELKNRYFYWMKNWDK